MGLIDQTTPLILTFALLLDAMLGDPDRVWRRVPHPVVLMGRLIGWLDMALNRGDMAGRKRLAGVGALAFLMAVTASAGAALHWLFLQHPFGLAAEIVAVAILRAQRGLYDHVRRVYAAFGEDGLLDARRAVARIVGRDPDTLDEAGVCRAAIETLAENFSDAVVAPAFWYLIAGLPGIAVYKAVNTADSMIGHRSPRHEAFGWAAARLDDLLNLIPARLSGLFIVTAAWLTRADARGAWSAMLSDARHHRSTNAGWPEAAMAGALGVALAGPRHYGGKLVEDGRMNAGGRVEIRSGDIARGLRLFAASCAVQVFIVTAIAILARST
jgi:adenosylcobinamide-phosphate synthase